jgi:hypothetical protein
MDEDPSQPSQQPAEPERSDAAARAGDLAAHAKAAEDATFDDDEDTARRIVPGVFSGDVGPKGRISAQMRDLSRTAQAKYGEVPRGTTTDRGGRYLLGTMLALALGAAALALLIGWLATR